MSAILLAIRHFLRSLLFNCFDFFFKKNAKIKDSSKDASYIFILNDGLIMAMEFGANWLAPIQDRLKERYPNLSDIEANTINDICRGAMFYGHEVIYKLAEKAGASLNQDEAAQIIKKKYDWMNDIAINKLISQGIYYSWKDGLF